ncbi:MAG: FAD-dependent oxidoreductase [Kiritimatiellia bacterium]
MSKIAVVGAGIAGLTAAWKLQDRADITLYEKNDYIGGHTRTLTVPNGPDEGTPVDTGFIVMNHRNYPHFSALLEEWEVELEDSDMSFSYHDLNNGYAYAGTTLRGLFPTPGHCMNRAHWTLIRELRRFGKVGTDALTHGSAATQSLGDFLEQHRFAPVFRDRYLFAMGAAIWSSPPERLADFPAEPYLHFFQNHGLLTLKDRPRWRVVKGGSQSYVRKALSRLKAAVHTAETPEAIFRSPEGVDLCFSDGRKESFDHVIIGTHADEALKLLGDPDASETARLGPWTYQANQVVLHRWEGVMPAPKACWASWNFAREPAFNAAEPVSVSYWMNRLQNLTARHSYFVTLNRKGEIPGETVLNRTTLHHPQYDLKAMAAQAPLREQNGQRNTWFVGSYFGYGFHEDAVRSAVDACAKLEKRL